MRENKTGIQGIQYSNHYLAAVSYFGPDVKTVPFMAFSAMCEALSAGQIGTAVMAIENSIAGSLLDNYGLIREYRLKAVGECYLRIRHALLASRGTAIGDVLLIRSHPMALRQCKHFICSLKGVRCITIEDTAAGAKALSENPEPGVAVIAPPGAKAFGLSLLTNEIEDDEANYTRFLILKNDKKSNHNTQQRKWMLYTELSHKCGSLSGLLQYIADNNCNLTKLQSMPIIGRPGEYGFYMDLTAPEGLTWCAFIKMLSGMSQSTELIGCFDPREIPQQ